MEPISTHFTGFLTPVFLLSGAVLLLFLIRFLTRQIQKLTIRNRRIVLGVLGTLALLIQLFMILGLQPGVQFDSLKPIDTAMYLLNGGNIKNSVFYDYLARNPHNLPITLYVFCIFKVLRIVGIPQSCYLIILQLLNLLLIDSSLLAAYRFLKNRMGLQSSIGFLMLCIFNPLMYYYPTFFYTQVLSFPIFVFLILLFFKILETGHKKALICYGALFGITLFFGWKIRFLTLITLIAASMYLFFYKGSYKKASKAWITLLLSLVVAFSCCTLLQEAVVRHYSLTLESEKAMPIQHFIMMGVGENGIYNYEDEDFTMSFATKEERIAENTAVIKQRLSDLKLKGLIRLFGKKLSITWSDGYDDYASNLLYTKNYTAVNDWLCGEHAVFLTGYLHIYHCMLSFLVFLCAVQILRKKLPAFSYVIAITILGGMLFHLIWEAGEAYSMPFVGLLTMAAALGSDTLTLPSFERIFTRKKALTVVLSAACLFLVLVLRQIPSLTEETYNFDKISAYQGMFFGEYIDLKDGQTLVQTVQADRSFNTLTLLYKYYGECSDDTAVTLRILDSEQNLLAEESLVLSDILDRHTFRFDEIAPKSRDTYFIHLTAHGIPSDARCAFAGYNTGNWDAYPAGTFSMDEMELKSTDLYFELKNCVTDTLL